MVSSLVYPSEMGANFFSTQRNNSIEGDSEHICKHILLNLCECLTLSIIQFGYGTNDWEVNEGLGVSMRNV